MVTKDSALPCPLFAHKGLILDIYLHHNLRKLRIDRLYKTITLQVIEPSYCNDPFNKSIEVYCPQLNCNQQQFLHSSTEDNGKVVRGGLDQFCK